MNDSEFFELANRAIDGACSDDEQESLANELRNSVARRLEYEQLASVVNVLNAVRPVEPPADLKSRIMASVSAQTQKRVVPAGPGLLDRLKNLVAARPIPAFAYAAVSGILIGALALTLVYGGMSGVDGSDAVGTIAPRSSVIDAAEVTVGMATVPLSLERWGERIVLKFSAIASVESPMTVIIEDGIWTGILSEGSASLPEIDRSASGIKLQLTTSDTYRLSALWSDQLARAGVSATLIQGGESITATLRQADSGM